MIYCPSTNHNELDLEQSNRPEGHNNLQVLILVEFSELK